MSTIKSKIQSTVASNTNTVIGSVGMLMTVAAYMFPGETKFLLSNIANSIPTTPGISMLATARAAMVSDVVKHIGGSFKNKWLSKNDDSFVSSTLDIQEKLKQQQPLQATKRQNQPVVEKHSSTESSHKSASTGYSQIGLFCARAKQQSQHQQQPTSTFLSSLTNR